MIIEERKNFNILKYLFYFIWGFSLQMYEMVIPNMKFRPDLFSLIAILCLIFFIGTDIYINKFNIETSELIILLIFLSVIAVVCWHSTISAGLIFSSFFMIVIFGDLPFRGILKIFATFSGITIFMTLMLNKIGMLPSVISNSDFRIRNSLGFIYYSYGSILFFSFVATYLLLRKQKIRYVELLLLGLLNLYFFKYTDTKDPFIFTLIVLIYGLIRKLLKSSTTLLKWKFSKFLLHYIYIIAFILNLVITYSKGEVFFFFNQLVNGRLGLSKLGIEQYGISMWGTKLNFLGGATANSYFYIDSFFIQTLLSYGVVGTVLILILFTMIMKKSIDSNNYYLVFIMSLMAIDGMFEPYMLWLWYTPFPFLIGKILRKNINY